MTRVAIHLRNGFSLIELLTVIAVLGVLIGLLLSAVQNVRGAAVRAACANNLRQLGHACHMYHDLHSQLPPSYGDAPELGPGRVLTWPVRILPFIEQDNLYNLSIAAHRAESIDFRNPPHVGLATVVKVYACPADGRLQTAITDANGYTAAYGSYVGVAGSDKANGAMRAQSGVRLSEVTDGTSSTLLIGEKPPLGRNLDGNWYTITVPSSGPPAGSGISYLQVLFPTGVGGCAGPIGFGPGILTNPCDNHHFWSLHSGGANFLFVDGGVRFLRHSIRDVMPALATRAGGEIVDMPD